MLHVKKNPLSRKGNLVHTKLGLEWTMKGLGKPFRKKPNQKIEKTVKIKGKLPHVNKKPQARKPIFVQTLFSHSTLKIERKFSRRKTACFFAPLPVSIL